MATYLHPISIRWGGGTAPTTVRVIDSAGAAQTPSFTTAIAQTLGGVYTAVATFDTAWGMAKDWWTNGDGNYYPGDGPGAANLLKINGSDFTLTSIRTINVNQRDINIEDRT